MPGIISIEGNLGAGKTTLLSLLNIQSIKEPVDEWANLGGSNLLQNYYQNPKRWAFTFQLNALHSRNKLWRETIAERPQDIHFSERSPLADRYVFGEIMNNQGNFDNAEYTIYDGLCKELIKRCPINAIIYLKCSPELCLERVRKRDRKGEEGITLQFLQKVHQKHQEWLMSIKDTEILTIDTGIYDIFAEKDQDEVIQLMKRFIQKAKLEATIEKRLISKPIEEKTIKVEV